MMATKLQGALAGPSSDCPGNRFPRYEGSDEARAACPGVGRVPDSPYTWSEPVVGA